MGYRLRDARPRVALWMLVALGDIVLLLVSAGLPVLYALISVVTVTLAGVGARRFARRNALARDNAVTVPVSARRRA
ncbi:hypothetical protein OG777_07145 [Micromonospora peucetia]|uniref:Uncharacterized protein n=1 Tax=Micromonospora peucetia TaxID=47871 RepID=A0A1C6UGN0_9ACTN|nr:hypothetical protein [Micromonospora peucetia]MCX4386704.1 hypothetical protein [Micromonospora peucetia]WSA34033.1 hypothetical protein OIE14_08310 [Micromonospora peucetia]SCL53108.1 hypothetical protein GA0070608_1123 [Micromonospora peucetia]